MNRFAFESNNTEFNPLFEKMRERFCSEGTVAEQLAKRASEYKKTKKRIAPEHHLTTANSLPRVAAETKAKKRSFFGIKNVGSACVRLLAASTVLFSGAAIGSLRADEPVSTAVLSTQAAEAEETMVLFENAPTESLESELNINLANS